VPASVKLRFVLPVLVAALAALLVAGCGGGDSGSGDGTDPASVAPAKAPVFISFGVEPGSETAENIDALAKKIAGVDNLGELIVGELENAAAGEGEGFDYEKEVAPWVGVEAGLFLQDYEGEDFESYGVAAQVTDEDEARAFVDKQIENGDEASEDGSYNGVDFKVQEDETTIGVFDGLVVFAEDEATFKEMVDASEGENLAGDEDFSSAISGAPDSSAADVFVDVGGLIEEAGGEIDSQAQTFLDTVGIEPDEATAVASLIPGSDQIEIDISSDLSGENPPSGDAAELLESLPASSVAAFASPEFGKRFSEGIDKIDEQGIPGQVPPNQLKKTLKQAGVDLEAIASSIGDVGGYVTGNSEKTLGGALVLEAEDETKAQNTVSNIGLFLRKTGTPGITKISEDATGFSIRSPELGRQPVVVVAKGSKIAIGYGLAPTLASFQESGKTLADWAPFREASDALGGTPIALFVNGPSALNLAKALMAGEEAEEFEEAEQYLRKISYLAIGSEASDNLAKAKLIIGVK
jgi:Protein of unknown function (DUF3352)